MLEKGAFEKELEERAYINSLRKVLLTEDGRVVFEKLLDITGLFLLSFEGVRENTAFNEGIRNVGLRMFADAVKASETDKRVKEKLREMLIK